VRRIPIQLVAGGWWSLDRLERPNRLEPAALVTPETPALVTFTTGTTGRPKAAARSHGFLWAQHRVLARHLGTREDDVDLPTLPVFVLHNLAAGATTVLPALDPRRPAEFDAGTIAAQIERERVTTSAGSPLFYQRLTWCAAQRWRCRCACCSPARRCAETPRSSPASPRARGAALRSTGSQTGASLAASWHEQARRPDPLRAVGAPVPDRAAHRARARQSDRARLRLARGAAARRVVGEIVVSGPCCAATSTIPSPIARTRFGGRPFGIAPATGGRSATTVPVAWAA
jgi:hypothetical protein